MREKLVQVIEDMGICLLDVYEHEDADLRDYITDSLQFISFIVSIEKALCIQLPDDLARYDNLKSFNAFVKLLENCYLDQQQER